MNSSGSCRSSTDTTTRCCALEAQRPRRAARIPRRRGQRATGSADGPAGRVRRRDVCDLRAVAAQQTAAQTSDTTPALDTAAGATVPPPLDLTTAQTAVSSMASILFRIEREADGRVRICRTVKDIRDCIETGVLAAVLHIEGAEAIDPEFETLDVLHQAGCVRSARCGAGRTRSDTACRFAAPRRPTPDRA